MKLPNGQLGRIRHLLDAFVEGRPHLWRHCIAPRQRIAATAAWLTQLGVEPQELCKSDLDAVTACLETETPIMSFTPRGYIGVRDVSDDWSEVVRVLWEVHVFSHQRDGSAIVPPPVGVRFGDGRDR